MKEYEMKINIGKTEVAEVNDKEAQPKKEISQMLYTKCFIIRK